MVMQKEKQPLLGGGLSSPKPRQVLQGASLGLAETQRQNFSSVQLVTGGSGQE